LTKKRAIMPPGKSMPTKIMIIRHGEKPSDDGAIRGVSEDGSHDPNELAVRGWQRAGALVHFFAPTNHQFSHPALATPDVIFASAPTGHIESLRSKHTVLLVAQFLQKRVNLQHTRGEEEALVKEVLATSGVVLIAWEHKAILDLANRVVGDDHTCPQKWPDSRFDLVWVFDGAGQSSGWAFTQVPQLLLPDDSPHTL
jgi:hypothetical protein